MLGEILKGCQQFFSGRSVLELARQDCFAPSDQSDDPDENGRGPQDDISQPSDFENAKRPPSGLRTTRYLWREALLINGLAAVRELVNASRVPRQAFVTEGGVTVEGQVWDAGAAWELVSESA